MPNLLGVLLAVVIVGGGYLYNMRSSRRGDLERVVAESRFDDRAVARSGSSLRSALLFMVGLGLFFLVLRQLDRSWEARHPAVKEHRAELMELASGRMGCRSDLLTIVAESPMRARVVGCGRVESFRWGKSPRGIRWSQIDPSCTTEIMGCTRPCE